MKKFTCFILAAAFALTLFGCGSKPQNNTPDTPPEPPPEEIIMPDGEQENYTFTTLYDAAEEKEVSAEAAEKINRAKKNGRRVICVGTTSCRTVESAADGRGMLKACCGDTQIFIYPGYRFKVLDALITNFHLPESTLVMLVSALAGREQVLHAYEEAIREKYRFFSFGDAMFIC